MVFFFDRWLINSIPQVLLTSIIVWGGLSKKAMTAPSFLTARDTNSCLNNPALDRKVNTDSIISVPPSLLQSQASSSKSEIMANWEKLREKLNTHDTSDNSLIVSISDRNHSRVFQSTNTEPSISISVNNNVAAASFSDMSGSKYQSYSSNGSQNNSRNDYGPAKCIEF